MKLYLMRHGQAQPSSIDPRQGLSEAGREEINRLAMRLAEQSTGFAQIFHSDKDRARQTAEIMASVCAAGVTPQFMAGLKPNDDPAKLIPMLDGLEVDTLIVSHLPFVPGLLSKLTGQSFGMDIHTGSIFCLAHSEAGWQLVWSESP